MRLFRREHLGIRHIGGADVVDLLLLAPVFSGLLLFGRPLLAKLLELSVEMLKRPKDILVGVGLFRLRCQRLVNDSQTLVKAGLALSPFSAVLVVLCPLSLPALALGLHGAMRDRLLLFGFGLFRVLGRLFLIV